MGAVVEDHRVAIDDAAAVSVTRTDPTDQRLTSTLKFVPRPLDVGQVPIPFHPGLGPESFGFVTFWPWNALILGRASAAAPAVVVPPPEGAPIGGLQLDVQPWRAQVYVYGAYVGLVDDFNGYYQGGSRTRSLASDHHM